MTAAVQRRRLATHMPEAGEGHRRSRAPTRRQLPRAASVSSRPRRGRLRRAPRADRASARAAVDHRSATPTPTARPHQPISDSSAAVAEARASDARRRSRHTVSRSGTRPPAATPRSPAVDAAERRLRGLKVSSHPGSGSATPLARRSSRPFAATRSYHRRMSEITDVLARRSSPCPPRASGWRSPRSWPCAARPTGARARACWSPRTAPRSATSAAAASRATSPTWPGS